MRRASSRLASLSASSLCVDASAQCIHEVDDFRRRPLPRYLDFLTGLLLLQQLLQRIFVVVLKFFGLEVAGLGFDDVRRQLQHVLRNFLILDIVEILVLFADLVRISQRDAEEPFAARFQGDDVLALGEDNPAERNHAFLADRLADYRECLLADFAVRHEVVRTV